MDFGGNGDAIVGRDLIEVVDKFCCEDADGRRRESDVKIAFGANIHLAEVVIKETLVATVVSAMSQ